MSNLLQNILATLKDDIEVTEIPVALNAIQIYQKNPNPLGRAAAIQSLIVNAPTALLTAGSAFLTTAAGEVNSLLTAELTKAQAALTPKEAAGASQPG